jgi:hypothetical protein
VSVSMIGSCPELVKSALVFGSNAPCHNFVVHTCDNFGNVMFLATDPEVRVRFSVLPDFLRSNGSGTGSTQPREYN